LHAYANGKSYPKPRGGRWLTVQSRRDSRAGDGFENTQSSALNGPPKAKVTLPIDRLGKENL
jgi:hypothetical protein